MDECVNAYCDPESPCDDCYDANISAALAEMGIHNAERAAESMADRWDDDVTMREFLVDCE